MLILSPIIALQNRDGLIMMYIITLENSLGIKLSNGSNTESNPITDSLFLALRRKKKKISQNNTHPLTVDRANCVSCCAEIGLSIVSYKV